MKLPAASARASIASTQSAIRALQGVDALAHEEAEVGRDLFVAAASGVQFVAGRADQRSELLFYEVVNVFGFGIVQKFRRGFGAAGDFSQRLSRFRKALRRKALQRVRARSRGRGWRRVRRAAAADRRGTTAAIFQIRGQAAAGSGRTTFSLRDLQQAARTLGFRSASYQGIALAMPIVSKSDTPLGDGFRQVPILKPAPKGAVRF